MTPEDTATLVLALVAEAKRLGLVWTIRPATVTATAGSSTATGIFDSNNADEAEIPLINLAGVITGDRAYVMSIKEGGNYIIGSPDVVQRQIQMIDAQVSTTNPAASSGSVGTEVAVASVNWLREPTYIFEPGFVYGVHCQGVHSPSALAQAAQVRIREGTATTTGTLLWFNTCTAASIFAPESWDFLAYIQNATAAPIVTQLSMSVARVAGVAGAHTIGGFTNEPLLMNVSRVGTITKNPGLALIAGSLT